jgi:hypothetical protein
MRSTSRSQTARRLAGIVNMVMALAYVACGLSLFFLPSAGRVISAELRLPVAWALVLYGIFRGWRSFNQLADKL